MLPMFRPCGSHSSSALSPEYGMVRIALIAVIASHKMDCFRLFFDGRRRHAIYLVLVGGTRALHPAAGTPGLLSHPINSIYLFGRLVFTK
jgi:hypothetical protein